MARTKSSHRWLEEHFSDPYVKKAQAEGYRSRAAFKLLEIQAKDKLLLPGQVVVELGAAPGSWTQIIAKIVQARGRVFAVDLLAMDPLPGVEFLQGDFQSVEILEALRAFVGPRSVDLVLSDMAPNISGIVQADQARTVDLIESALAFADEVLKPGGSFLAKGFQGAGFESLLKQLRARFTKVLIRKPEASRARSSELYFLARGFNRV